MTATLGHIIDAVLETHFDFEPKARERRGVVHTCVARAMGLRMSNDLALAIRGRVLLRGARPTRTRARQFYRGMCLKNDVERPMPQGS